MLTYTYDTDSLVLTEKANSKDIEFHIHVLGDASYDQQVKGVQADFQHNHVLTDVLFYVFQDHTYQFIVRHDFYEAFLLSLMKHRLLTSLRWT